MDQQDRRTTITSCSSKMTLDDITILEDCNLKEMLKKSATVHTANCSLSCRLQSGTVAVRTHSSHRRDCCICLCLALSLCCCHHLSPYHQRHSRSLPSLSLCVTVMLSVSTISSDQLGLSLFWIVSLTISTPSSPSSPCVSLCWL